MLLADIKQKGLNLGQIVELVAPNDTRHILGYYRDLQNSNLGYSVLYGGRILGGEIRDIEAVPLSGLDRLLGPFDMSQALEMDVSELGIERASRAIKKLANQGQYIEVQKEITGSVTVGYYLTLYENNGNNYIVIANTIDSGKPIKPSAIELPKVRKLRLFERKLVA